MVLGCLGLTVPSEKSLCVRMVLRNHGFTIPLGLRILSVPLDLRILSVPGGGKQIRGTCVFVSRMVLWLVLKSYGTLVAVSAQLVMPLHDSDIPMNVSITLRNKQTITTRCRGESGKEGREKEGERRTEGKKVREGLTVNEHHVPPPPY
jgi:hypothetical protein